MERNDRDMLIRVDQNVQNMIQKFEDLPCEAHGIKMDSMITRRWFMWIVGFIIVGVMTIAGITSVNKIALTEIQVEQKIMMETIKNGGGGD